MKPMEIGDGFLKKWEDKLSKSQIDIWIITALAALFSFLLYDFKVSEGGDDSAYISRAYDLLTVGKFPSFQGPIYPILLAAIIGLFGLKLQLLKLSSTLFMVLFFHIGYKFLKGRIPTIALFPAFALAAISPMLMYFSSQTYSEAFFLVLQMLFISVFFKTYIDNEASSSWKMHFMAAFLIWILGSTRTVGYAALPAAWLFLAIDKRWLDLGKISAWFAAVFVGMQGLKTAIFGGEFLQFGSQGGTLLLKDPYTPTNGNEGIAGFVSRFARNSELYLSKHYMKFLGLKEAANNETSSTITIVLVLLFAAALYFGWKNKSFRFIGILTVGFISLTFLAVQTRWDQARLILPYFPFYTLILFGGILYAFAHFRIAAGQIVYGIVVSLMLLTVLKNGSDIVSVSQKEFKEAVAGNPLAGYTPDWQSFILMSQYAAKYAPEDVMIASRKAGISFIYGERKFKGITRIPFTSIDSVDQSIDRIMIYAKDLDRVLSSTSLKRKDMDYLIFGEAKENSSVSSEEFFFAMEINSKNGEELTSRLDSLNISYFPTIDALVKNYKETYVIDPDGLIESLEADNVHYVVMASLRRNPNQRSEFIINTIQRYLYYIQAKYPSALEQIHTIGQASLEPASLIKINYAAVEAVNGE